MNHRFSVNEIAIVGHVVNREAKKFVGQECEVVATPESWDRFMFGRFLLAGKYLVLVAGEYWGCQEDNLRKRPQQDDNLFTNWFESHIITDIRPTETQVRQGLKGILEPFGSGEG